MGAYILVGGGGHAGVVVDALAAGGMAIRGIVDPAMRKGSVSSLGYEVLGDDDYLAQIARVDESLAMGIGFMPGCSRRKDVFEKLASVGWRFPIIRHPTAWASDQSEVSDGAQLMAGAVLQCRTTIGVNSIVNTGVIIEHDVSVGAHTHVASGATVCGGVTLGDLVFVGAGATIVQGVTIGTGAVIGAGATVLNDVPANTRVVGTPARTIRVRKK